MLALSLEEMGLDDVREVAALEAAAFPPHHVDGAPPPETTNADIHEARLREELARPWTKLWVARAADRSVLGFLLAWHVVDEIHILNVAAAVAHRRRGIGRALMLHAMKYGSANAVRHLLLEVRRSNTSAIRLYRALGFFATNIRRTYYANGEDAIEMMLSLDPETGAVVRKEDEVRLEDA